MPNLFAPNSMSKQLRNQRKYLDLEVLDNDIKEGRHLRLVDVDDFLDNPELNLMNKHY